MCYRAGGGAAGVTGASGAFGAAGEIDRWLVEPGTTVPVGTPLALIATAAPAERGIALAGLSGSGPGGAILRADVEHEAGVPSARPAASKRLDLQEMRRAIAAADLRVWAYRGEIFQLSGRASRRPDRLDLTTPGGWLPTYGSF